MVDKRWLILKLGYVSRMEGVVGGGLGTMTYDVAQIHAHSMPAGTEQIWTNMA